MDDGEGGYHRAAQINTKLHDVGPNDGCHAPFECVEKREDGHYCNCSYIADQVAHAGQEATESDADHDGNGEHAHSLSGRACHKKQAGGKRAQSGAEAARN
jgi:hypothetical protein